MQPPRSALPDLINESVTVSEGPVAEMVEKDAETISKERSTIPECQKRQSPE
jgi:hypothetical protein